MPIWLVSNRVAIFRAGETQVVSTTFQKQPEAWMAPDGSKIISRSHAGDIPTGDNKLFWFRLIERASDAEIAAALP